MTGVAVTVATATEFSTNAASDILIITFTNTEAFTPKDGTNYYYTVKLEEASKTTTEFVFKVESDGEIIGAATEKSFTVDNAVTQFTSGAEAITKAIYYTKAATV